MTKQILTALKVSFLAVVLSFGVSYALAWTTPTATAPGGNVAAPINAGAIAQVKIGSLTIGNSTTPSTITSYGDMCVVILGVTKCLSSAQLLAPTITSFYATPTTVANGGSSALTWTTSGATSCTAGGSWSGSKATAGTSVPIGPLPGPATYTYTLVCVNASGVSSAQASASVYANAPVLASCTTPWGTTVTSGNSATGYLASSVTSPATCSSQTSVCNNGTWSPAFGSYIYSSCTVQAAAAPSVTLSAAPTIVQNGQSSTLTFSSTGATSCTVTPSTGGGSPITYTMTDGVSRTYTTSALSGIAGPLTYTYTLSCTGVGGTTSKSATVQALAPFSATYINGAGGSIAIPTGVTKITFNGYGGHGFQGGQCGDYSYAGAGGGASAFAYSGAATSPSWIIVLGGGGGAGAGYCTQVSVPSASSASGLTYSTIAIGSLGGSTASGNGFGLGGGDGGLPSYSGKGGDGALGAGGNGNTGSSAGGIGGISNVNGGNGGTYTATVFGGGTATYSGGFGGGGGTDTTKTGGFSTSGGDGYLTNAAGGGGGYGGGGGGGASNRPGGGGGSFMATGMTAASASGRSILLSAIGNPTSIYVYAGKDGVSYNGNRGPGASITLSY